MRNTNEKKLQQSNESPTVFGQGGRLFRKRLCQNKVYLFYYRSTRLQATTFQATARSRPTVSWSRAEPAVTIYTQYTVLQQSIVSPCAGSVCTIVQRQPTKKHVPQQQKDRADLFGKHPGKYDLRQQCNISRSNNCKKILRISSRSSAADMRHCAGSVCVQYHSIKLAQEARAR